MSTPAEVYDGRIARASRAAEALRATSRRTSLARAIVFAIALALGVLAESTASFVAGAAAIASVAGFIALVVLHRRVREREAWQEALARVNREGRARLAREWDAIPQRIGAGDVAAHPYAADLDVFGRASLAQLLGPVATPLGVRQLRGWLLERADGEVVRERQAAARELAPANDFRDAVAVHASRAAGTPVRHLDAFLEWAEGERWPGHRRAMLWIARLLLVAVWALIAADALDLAPTRAWVTAVAVAFLYSAGLRKRLHAVYDRAFASEGIFKAYPELLATIEGQRWDAPLLRALRGRIAEGEGSGASAALARLRRIMELSELRYSSYGYLVLQPITLWDFHVLAWLERWQSRHGGAVRAWLESAGEVEALASLATLAHDQPEWAFPAIDAARASFEAAQLAHPLLRDDVRRANDVRVGPPGTLLFITGSNMSGKSTLLRAIGANAVLAQAGAPVCARALAMPPLRVWASIRVQDSLESGVSLFMAELRCVKSIVEAARAASRDGGAPVLYLLDEMLHGTNTAERRIAARRVLAHLLAERAIGAVTSHDVTLANEPPISDAAVTVHFKETVHADDAETPMTFDYQLRPGIATSTNALRLLGLVGLE